ncbi:hypothetical protein Q3V23_22680 [Streptomyces sp. VNUA116]|uniref:hypothetical protein n=1 Tax=Streptomyces sp. VNUA116 TaxID=3062449 RepID=UPI00267451CE|nr:hypothetical protein [Streptomyces sp. VNUA116]WKU46633.1 hypothetical protein Q3V23_22680 [Streptomyces sp. VNUA116]
MSGEQEQTCYACSGDGLTEKTQHSVELDEHGNQVSVTHSFISPCSQCSGTGKVSG